MPVARKYPYILVFFVGGERETWCGHIRCRRKHHKLGLPLCRAYLKHNKSGVYGFSHKIYMHTVFVGGDFSAGLLWVPGPSAWVLPVVIAKRFADFCGETTNKLCSTGKKEKHTYLCLYPTLYTSCTQRDLHVHSTPVKGGAPCGLSLSKIVYCEQRHLRFVSRCAAVHPS